MQCGSSKHAYHCLSLLVQSVQQVSSQRRRLCSRHHSCQCEIYMHHKWTQLLVLCTTTHVCAIQGKTVYLRVQQDKHWLVTSSVLACRQPHSIQSVVRCKLCAHLHKCVCNTAQNAQLRVQQDKHQLWFSLIPAQRQQQPIVYQPNCKLHASSHLRLCHTGQKRQIEGPARQAPASV